MNLLNFAYRKSEPKSHTPLLKKPSVEPPIESSPVNPLKTSEQIYTDQPYLDSDGQIEDGLIEVRGEKVLEEEMKGSTITFMNRDIAGVPSLELNLENSKTKKSLSITENQRGNKVAPEIIGSKTNDEVKPSQLKFHQTGRISKLNV